VVEGHDPRDDSEGAAPGEVQVLGGGGDRVAAQVRGEVGEEVEEFGAPGDVGAHRGHGVAGVEGVEQRQLVGVCPHRFGERAQSPSALAYVEGAPGAAGVGGCADDGVDVRLRRVRCRGDDRLAGGTFHVVRTAAEGVPRMPAHRQAPLAVRDGRDRRLDRLLRT
jgi:hypothetical protein